MSRKHPITLTFQWALMGVLAITSAAFASSFEFNESPCVSASPVDLNSSLRGYSGRQGESLSFKLEIPSPGILSVDVSVPGIAVVGPRLGFVTAGCSESSANSSTAVLERSTTHLVLAAQVPGTYVFRIASQDPSLPLGDFKLRTGFAPDDPNNDLLSKGGEDEEELVIDPNPPIYVGPGENRSLHSKLRDLCRSGEVDDHGDSLTCATFLNPGQDVVGEIRNGRGDDDDVFQFVLGGSHGTDLWSLEVEASSEVEVLGELYDRAGTRLEMGREGDGGNFTIVRTLPPGTYFVRIEARTGAEGFYALSVNASPW